MYPSIYLRFIGKGSLKIGDEEPDIHNLNSRWTRVVFSNSSLFYLRSNTMQYPAKCVDITDVPYSLKERKFSYT